MQASRQSAGILAGMSSLRWRPGWLLAIAVRNTAGRSEDDEMLLAGAFYNISRNAGIEGDESAGMLDGQGEKIRVGHLLMAAESVALEDGGICHRQIVGPKLVMATGLGGFQFGEDIGGGQWGRVARIGEDTQATVFG